MTRIWTPWQAHREKGLAKRPLPAPPLMSVFPSGFDVCLKHIIARTYSTTIGRTKCGFKKNLMKFPNLN